MGLVLTAWALAGGCAAPPWSTSSATPPMGPSMPATASPTMPGRPSPPPPVPSSAGANPQTPQMVLAEVKRLGETHPAAQAQLLAELEQAEPSLWPLVLQNFQSRLAYAQQHQRRNATAPSGQLAVEAPGASASAPTSASDAPAAHVARLPVSSDVALPPAAPPEDQQTDPPQTTSPSAPAVSVPSTAADPPPVEMQPATPDVRQASYTEETTAETSVDWRKPLGEAARRLESQLAARPSTDADMTQHARLRLLQLAAGARDEAMAPIPSADGETDDFWSKQIFGLSVLLDAQRNTDSARRAAEAKRHLAEAIVRLSESAALEVHNLAFCREVQSYGSIKRFDKYEFTPGQRVLLYAEVENFTSEPTADGYHTSLRSSYQIFDASGRRVEQQESTTTEEYCTNPRRDYFIGCDFHLPTRIYPGPHTLKLTIEDLKSQKVGESSIEFTIK